MKTILITIITCLTINTAHSQLEMLQIEKGSKKLNLVIPDPFIVPEFPTGLIYQDTSDNGFVNLSTNHLRVASRPIGFQFQKQSIVWTEMNRNTFSINKLKGLLDLRDPLYNVDEGPNTMGFWGPRSPANAFNSKYDLNTYGNIWNKDVKNRKLIELTDSNHGGAIKLHRYIDSSFGTFAYSHLLSVNDEGNISWTAVSDRRLKENIKPMTPLLDKVTKLEMKTYNYIGSKVSTKGYIAQEVQEIFPELVEEMDEGYLGVNYAGFSTLAIQAVKEQQEIIDNLEERLAKLEALLEKH